MGIFFKSDVHKMCFAVKSRYTQAREKTVKSQPGNEDLS